MESGTGEESTTYKSKFTSITAEFSKKALKAKKG
jgi:hypothetical protein